MNMRSQFIETTKDLIASDPRIVAMLGDIGVYSFRHTIEAHPDRIFDIGILEQASISMAAGLAVSGMIPIFHTIAPFLVERAYEQLKLDFGYQHLGGNFVSVGASFDYSALGSTHHCPADVNVLKQIPNMQIVVPGTSREFDALYRSQYANGEPTYFRLSEQSNLTDQPVVFGRATIVKRGSRAIVLAVGPMLHSVLEAASDLDVTILYYTTLAPFDGQALRDVYTGGPVVLCEPYYQGGLLFDVVSALEHKLQSVELIGVPHEFIHRYGTYEENEKTFGMDALGIRRKLECIL